MTRPCWQLNRILEFPTIWRFFRKFIDVFGGIYSKRIAILREFGVAKNTSVIDIACGTGPYSQITEAAYLGIDMDKSYIEDAQKRYGNSRRKFLCADANAALIPDASYEAALLIDATHHLTDDENRTLFKTLGRIASKMIIICDPVKQSRKNLVGRFLTSLDRGHYIRSKEALLSLVHEFFEVSVVEQTKLLCVEGLCILAKPKNLNRH